MSQESAQQARTDLVLTLTARPLNGATENADIAPTVIKLIDLGIDLEARDDKGRTPLIIATINFRPKILEALLDAGADMSARDNDGLTCLDHHARGKRNKLRGEMLQLHAEKLRQKKIEEVSKPETVSVRKPTAVFSKRIKLTPRKPA